MFAANDPASSTHLELSPSSVTLGSVTEHLGLTPRAIRFYEERGLVRPTRDRLNRRRFDANARARLKLIAQLRSANLGLEEVRLVVQCADLTKRRTLARDLLALKAAELEAELRTVDSVLTALQAEDSI